MEIKISPSMLASDFANLEAELNKCKNAGAELIHLDVMDGHFVQIGRASCRDRVLRLV